MEITLKPSNSSLKLVLPKYFLFFALFGLILSALFHWTTPYMAIASVAYFSLLTGVLFHSQKRIHIPLMSAGALIDLTLVAILEIKRSAIATAFGGTLNPLQLGHILASSAAVALYIPTVLYGIRGKITHRTLGRIAFVLRTIGFILMFSLLEHVQK